MIEQPFDSLSALLGYYRFTKANVRGCKAIIPKETGEQDQHNARAAQSSMEEKFCFIADIEKFANYYYNIQKNKYPPVPMNVLHEIFISANGFGEQAATFGQLANRYRDRIEKGEIMPRSLKHKQHLWAIATHMRESAEPYFIDKGYINGE